MALSQAAKRGAHPASPAGVVSSATFLPLYLVGLAFVFVGERIVTSESSRYLLSGTGVVLALTTVVSRLINAVRSPAGEHASERRRAELSLTACSACGLVALVVYFATSDLGRNLLHIASLKPDMRARFESAGLVVWVALFVIAILPLVLGELALGPMRKAERIEAGRVAAAIRTGLVLAFVAIYVSLFTYVAGELDAKVDYSYFRTARAGESTRRIASQLAEPITVPGVLSPLNEVGVEVLDYLRDASRGASNLKVEEVDRLLAPTVAKEAKVTTDGIVVLTRGTSREALNVGVDMKTAASKLKTLDADFQKALLKVLRKDRVAYLTVGHGEINETRSEQSEGRSVKGLRKLLESQGYAVKDLGLTQGLGNEVPSDATMVVVLGPTQLFLPEEVDTLRRFAERGGHLFLGLDPDAKLDLSSLAESSVFRTVPCTSCKRAPSCAVGTTTPIVRSS